MNNSTVTNLKINISKSQISNEMCLDITTPISPKSTDSMSPIMNNKNNKKQKN